MLLLRNWNVLVQGGWSQYPAISPQSKLQKVVDLYRSYLIFFSFFFYFLFKTGASIRGRLIKAFLVTLGQPALKIISTSGLYFLCPVCILLSYDFISCLKNQEVNPGSTWSHYIAQIEMCWCLVPGINRSFAGLHRPRHKEGFLTSPSWSSREAGWAWFEWGTSGLGFPGIYHHAI